MATMQQFHNAVGRLVGKAFTDKLIDDGFSPHDLCITVAQEMLVEGVNPSPSKQEDIALVRQVAMSLWKGEGVHGLVKDSGLSDDPEKNR